MSIDVFGRSLNNTVLKRGPQGIGFRITQNGNYDLENKRLCNIAEAEEDRDAVNLSLLTSKLRDTIALSQEGFDGLQKRLLNTINALQIDLDNAQTLIVNDRADIDSRLSRIELAIKKLEAATRVIAH